MKYFSASFYYVRYLILGKIIRETYRQFNWRVWLLSVGFIFLYFVNQLLHIFFRLLDEVFFSGHRNVVVKEPVFIISNPRSGTTFLHRLVSLDGDRFRSVKFSHTFQMTTSFVKFANLLKWLDKYIGNVLRNSINWMDEKFWGAWDDIHAMGFNKAEEDELVFAQMAMSTGIFLPFPYFDKINENKFLDREPDEVRKNVMDFYQSCVKRFMHAFNGDKTYLAKNVMNTGRFKSLMQRFPDARIIYIARHPYDAIPSCASMFTSMYKWHSPEMPDDAPPKKAWGQLGIDFFKYSAEMKKTIPPGQFFELKYDELLQNPNDAVMSIYKHFNWTPSEKFLDKLAHAEIKNRDYKSGHEYSLEQFGFTKQEVYAELGSLMDEKGFDKGF